MGEVVEAVSAVEPNEWYVVFNRTSANPILSFLACGEFKHVAAFGYLPGVKMWLVYDVQWSGTRVWLANQQAIMEWTRGCDILKIAAIRKRMILPGRLGLYCVSAVKHLLGAKCVAVTPSQLYRHILRNGGIVISDARRPASPAARPDVRPGAAAGTG